MTFIFSRIDPMKQLHLSTVFCLLALSLLFCFSAAAQKDDRYLIQANKLLDKKKYDEAVEAYRKSFAQQPNWKAAYGIGSDYLRKGDFAEANAYFRRAQEIKADEPLIWYSLGYSFGRMGENERAVDALRKSVELKPDYADAWYNLGSVLFRSARFQEAIEAYRKTVELRPKDAEAHAFLGVAYAQINDLDRAVESFQKAVKIAPKNESYRQNLAALELKLREQNPK